MFDERAVQTAKIWKELGALRASSGLREEQFEQFTLMVIGFILLEQSIKYTTFQMISRKLANQESENFNGLTTQSFYNYEGDFRSAWMNTWQHLIHDFLPINRDGMPSEVGSFQAFARIVSTLDRLDERWESKEDFLLDCFDEVFHRVMSRLAGTGYRSGDAAAILAAHLSIHDRSISEYFAITGEFAVQHALINSNTFAHIAVLDRLNFFIGLRLFLHSIDTNDDTSNVDDPEFFRGSDFLLIDHPSRATSGRHQYLSRWADCQSSLQALDYIGRALSYSGATLVIVPGVDRSAKGWRNNLRSELVQSGYLLAVIDLPHDRRHGSRKQVSAWLLGKRGQANDTVLMVDAHGLAGRGEFRDVGILMAFVAEIVLLGASDGWRSGSTPGKKRFKSDDVEAMLEAYFKDGYRDVEGVCQRIDVGELAEKTYTLAASVYIDGAHNGTKRKTFMPLLNSDPVLEVLQQRHKHGTRIYVIGNNGEGKSTLLGDLADRLVEDSQHVVGISFGLTDRFPFKPPKRDGQQFIYVGARTSERSIALSRTSADINRMVREIHVSTEKLKVFNALVGQIGFGQRRYLVPFGKNRSFDDDQEHYAELLQLTENADENLRIWQRADESNYELGLMREETQRSITRFGQLSSGEQQLLTLALKLTAYADRSTVILVDEPELSLHVNWQRAIPGMLQTVGSHTGCSMVVATHSPIVIASANDCDDKCFVARRHGLKELSIHQRRSVETALFDGFRTYTANNRQVHERCAAIVSQTIQRLNARSTLQDENLPTLEALHEELELMDQIIRLASPAQFSHAQEDLDLVARTRAAIDELASIEESNAT